MSKYDINTHGDFKKYYDSKYKRNYWVLGYFGGGAVNIVDAYELAKQFADAIKVPLETVQIDEVLKSRRYKHFKFLYSTVDEQKPEKDSNIIENVYQWLTD
jgi:hypothetical protein